MKCLFILLFSSMTGCGFSQDQYPGCLDSLQIANMFSTCGDGIRDGWGIYFPCKPDNFQLVIYDRWGQEVFISASPDFYWTAQNKEGKAVSAGLYFYVIQFTYLGEEKSYRGSLTYML